MLQYNSYSEKVDLIKNGRLSLKDNLLSFIERIDAYKHLNAFNFVFTEEAIKQSEVVQSKIEKGTAGKLAGMVIAVKDVLAIKDKPLTCSSKMLENFVSVYTATSVQKLIDEDAIIIGKTNCDEFAMGSSNENSFFGKVLNPVDNNKVPGGSSGGSAAAVAAFLCDAALGTDTGGSVRQPAAFCGVYGVKPSYSLVSRYGLTAFASSFDTVGVFANGVDDLALVLRVIAGYDEKDSTSAKVNVEEMIDISRKNYSVGIPKEYFSDGLDEEIRNAIEKIIINLKDKGITVKEISLPHTEYTIAAYYILTTAEASSNLARYDGARYGYRSENSNNLMDMYVNSRSEGFGSEVKRRIMLGTYVLSAGYYDAYYLKAQKVRRKIKEDFDNAFKQVDVIITPTTPTTAFGIGEKIDEPLQMYLGDIYTTSANLAGIPGVNVPISKSEKGLPIGMQVLANQFDEKTLLSFCSFVQNKILKR